MHAVKFGAGAAYHFLVALRLVGVGYTVGGEWHHVVALN